MTNQNANDIDAGLFLSSLAVSFGAWIITGAFGYGNWPKTSRRQLRDGEIMSLISLIFTFTVAFITAHCQLGSSPSQRVSASGVFVATTLSICTATAYCIATVDERGIFRHTFLVMGSVFLGWGFEWVTGAVTGVVRRLEGEAVVDGKKAGDGKAGDGKAGDGMEPVDVKL